MMLELLRKTVKTPQFNPKNIVILRSRLLDLRYPAHCLVTDLDDEESPAWVSPTPCADS